MLFVLVEGLMLSLITALPFSFSEQLFLESVQVEGGLVPIFTDVSKFMDDLGTFKALTFVT